MFFQLSGTQYSEKSGRRLSVYLQFPVPSVFTFFTFVAGETVIAALHFMPRRMRWSKKLQNIFSNFWADCCETSHETQILVYWNTGEFTLGSFHLAMFILFFKDKCSFVLDEMCDTSAESEKWKFFHLAILKG